MIIDNLIFSAHVDTQTLVIDGIPKIPHTQSINPFRKIWIGVKKRIKRASELDVIGFFNYDNEQHQAVCRFYLSTAPDNTQDEALARTARWEKDFCHEMALFEDAIQSFFLAKKNGYADYLVLMAQPDPSVGEYERMMNDFLISIRLRRPEEK